MKNYLFYDRDISWLWFNGRVLLEAERSSVPLLERIKFMSIFSSNLDEFYRVRMPALMALRKLQKNDDVNIIYSEAVQLIDHQQDTFGKILHNQILPALNDLGYKLVYKQEVPVQLTDRINHYFYTQVAGLLQPVLLTKMPEFFPENNQLYLAASLISKRKEEELYLVNVPVAILSRFITISEPDAVYIIFLEDVIRNNIRLLFPGKEYKDAYTIKITRDAELELQEEYDDDLAEKIEKQLSKRDNGFATRLLYEPGIPLLHLQRIIDVFNLKHASIVKGGPHHNLKDLSALRINDKELIYPARPGMAAIAIATGETLFELVTLEDRIIHTPYHSYDTVLRFFNEAAIHPEVEEIYITLYRVASDSRIAEALISAARNGKKVSVLVELKARFDEANNIHWAKKMKIAGVKILYSSNTLKVHAKIALVKRKHPTHPLIGLLATGNLNETTARFYTDHILLTSHQDLLGEMELLFFFLSKKKQPDAGDYFPLKHLLVAQFNLQSRFLTLIDREIGSATNGKPASIFIKLNNLEEEILIKKLYEASVAGVKIRLLVRSICRLVPGVPGQSENITIRRIVDRYLEHGRLFIFHNDGAEEVYMGSADWMNRNVYHRIEVCFPVYAQLVKEQLLKIMELQWQDNVQAVHVGEKMNMPLPVTDAPAVRSQEHIYFYLKDTASRS